MHLNHLDLPVADVAETRAFFERYLGFTHERTLGQDGLSILRDEAGLMLVLSKGGSFHIGFHLESEQDVQALYDRLAADGKAGAPPAHQRGAFSFYVTAPGGILVEIAHR